MKHSLSFEVTVRRFLFLIQASQPQNIVENTYFGSRFRARAPQLLLEAVNEFEENRVDDLIIRTLAQTRIHFGNFVNGRSRGFNRLMISRKPIDRK